MRDSEIDRLREGDWLSLGRTLSVGLGLGEEVLLIDELSVGDAENVML